jgi:hypothetical protein
MAELEQLTLDSSVSPGVIFGGHALDQHGNGIVDGRPSGAMGIRPFPRHQATMPAPDRVRGGQSVCPQRLGSNRINPAKTARPSGVSGSPCVARRPRDAAPRARRAWTLTNGRATPAGPQSTRRSDEASTLTRLVIMPVRRASITAGQIGEPTGTPQVVPGRRSCLSWRTTDPIPRGSWACSRRLPTPAAESPRARTATRARRRVCRCRCSRQRPTPPPAATGTTAQDRFRPWSCWTPPSSASCMGRFPIHSATSESGAGMSHGARASESRHAARGGIGSTWAGAIGPFCNLSTP